MTHHEKILILDFGSQFTQLIARRVRESNVYSEIQPHSFSLDEIKKMSPTGIILSGGPMSIYDEGAPKADEGIFDLGVPILGICYGLCYITSTFKGKIESADDREYGKATFNIDKSSQLLEGVDKNSTVWMSHGDLIKEVPKGFEVDGSSENSPICAISSIEKKIYGVQFHPEVTHTAEGSKIIKNFVFNICKCTGDWTPASFIEEKIKEVRELVGDKNVICALSGGVDSSVAAILIHKAIGDQLHCIHVDHGLMRKDESAVIMKMFEDSYNLKLISIDASKSFISKLAGVSDPEKKRKIIGNTFIEVFEEESVKIEDANFLVQGTLYPDVIESVSVKGASVTIKTHHNVGGLPEKMNLKLIEPFRELFKDEVRAIGRELGLPEQFIERHPFPGPGLAVRILSDITEDKIKVLQEADDIYINELHASGIYNEIWQAFAVLLPVQTVGVMGDFRTYENVIALRAVTSTDGMTADWYRFDMDILEKISNKIIRSVRGVNRVVYDISSKPPSTIEWE